MIDLGIDYEKYSKNGWISEDSVPLIFFDYKYNGCRACLVSRDCPSEIIEEMRKINDFVSSPRFRYSPRFFLPDMNGYEEAVEWCKNQKQRKQH